MEAKDLMINDWVSVSGTPMQVACIGTTKVGFYDEKGGIFFHLLHEEVKPIQLTAEILEKNGFQKNKISNYETLFNITQLYDFLYVRDIGIPEFVVGNSFDEEGELQDFTTIKYVHELQQALRLCGIEKEIEI